MVVGAPAHVDLQSQHVATEAGEVLPYDFLVVATGSSYGEPVKSAAAEASV